jgi:hypothetical protein
MPGQKKQTPPAPVVPIKIEEESEATEEDTEEEDEDMDGVRAEWEAYEDEVADLVDSLKRKLQQIDPGIGDQISLARFVRFVEANSSSL